MKKKNIIPPVLAVLALVGCSNEKSDFYDSNPTEGESAYMAVNLIMPETISRAVSDGFEDGTDNENKVTDALFLFYDAAGNGAQSPERVEISEWQDGNTPSIEKISGIVTLNTNISEPTQVLVILNASGEMERNITGKTLTQVRNMVDDYGVKNVNSTPGEVKPVYITNSTYVDESKEVCATDIIGKIYKTESEAWNNPVGIYVERVVAKVRTSATNKDFTITDPSITVTGENAGTVTLTPKIEGIEIANIADESYLFKNITGYESWTRSWGGWNDFNNRRSYWATSPSRLTYTNQSWNEIDETDPATAQTFYIQENTSDTKSCVLVTATLQKDGRGYEMVRRGKTYYTPEGFKNWVCNLLREEGYKVKKADGGTESIVPDDLEYLSGEAWNAQRENGRLEAYETVLQLSETGKVKTFEKNGQACTADDINNFLFGDEKDYVVWYWRGGKAYYFVDIEHFGPVAPFNVGVVRNHIYNLTLKSLRGVGTPVFDPDETIIPEKPEDDLFYLSANINILKWKLVKQDVNFDFE